MTYLQFLLVVHVLGAVVGFGSTFAFAVFPSDAEGLEPGVRTALADISYRLNTRMSAPVAFLIQPVTRRAVDLRDGQEPRVLRSHVALDRDHPVPRAAVDHPVRRPADTRHEYEVTRAGRTPDPNYRGRGNPNVYGPLLGVIIPVIVILMVWKPGD